MTMTRKEQIRTAAEEKTRGVGGNWEHIRKGAELWFIRGAIWADSHPHWISVEERLPEEEDLYIVSNGKETSVAYWVEDAWDSFGDVITHWMPLPAAPRKEE